MTLITMTLRQGGSQVIPLCITAISLTNLEQFQSFSSKMRIYMRFTPVEDTVDATVSFNQATSPTQHSGTKVLVKMIRLFTSKKKKPTR